MDRANKEKLVAELHTAFSEATLVVVTRQIGLTVAESTDLRAQMRDAGASFRVTKNRLAKLAIMGTPYEAVVELFTGPTAVAFSADPISAARIAARYAKGSDKLTIIGGALGETLLDADGVQQLAQLPSLDELRANFIGLINAPATKIAGVLQAPAGQLARVLKARSEQLGAA